MEGRVRGPTPRAAPLLLLAAALVSAACLGYRYRDDPARFTRWNLLSYDAHVYMAMAADPAFFTVGPWGYRILAPLIVHELPPRWHARGFLALCLTALWLSGVVLFLFLRRLGNGAAAALAALAAFLLSAPVARVVADPVLGDPLAILLELLLLYALEAGAGLGVLALLLALGILTKELFLALVPLVYLVRRSRAGDARGLGEAALLALPMLALFWTLRHWWTPQITLPAPAWDLDLLRSGLRSLLAARDETLVALLLGGLGPLALLGALRRRARPYLSRYGYAVVLTPLAALFAWINVPTARAKVFYGPNTERLLLYALPLLLPLALVALDRVWPHLRPPLPPGQPRQRTQLVAALGIAGCLALPFLALDPYRRIPLHERRDQRLTLAICTQSLRVARQLARGQSVRLNALEHRFETGDDADGWLGRLRWFLRDGWGEDAPYGVAEIRMQAPQAQLLLPCLEARDLDVTLRFASDLPRRLALRINGRPAGGALLKGGRSEAHVRLAGASLFRGDNLLTLAIADGGSPEGVVLEGLTLRYAP